jgi:lipid A 3-O-deacylase
LGLTAHTSDQLDFVTISLGVIGPASLADDTLKTSHWLLNIGLHRAWKHQLENESALNITYEHAWRIDGPRTRFWASIPISCHMPA